MNYFSKLATSYPMRVYVEVSKNHGYSLEEVIRGKFDPEIRMLIQFYNHQFYLEYHEYNKIRKQQKMQEEEFNQMMD